MTVWAIGDIHGRLDLLEPLIAHIIADAEAIAPLGESTIVVFLGDYVDRGSDSNGVIRCLSALPKDGAIEWRFLKGNHEQAMLDFLVDPTTGPIWCEYGGDAALASYGLRLPQMKHKPEGWAHLSADLDHLIAPPERRFLETLELSFCVGDYYFVHAGARPGVALATQSERDLLWIRGAFLDSDDEFEKVIVHGHTPAKAVHADHRRIGIDTKAYESGVLSALRLRGRDKALWQTSAHPDGGVVVFASNLDIAQTCPP